MKTYRLASTEMISAPGMIRWAINGYAFKRDRAIMAKIITEGWPGLTKEATKALLSKSVPFTVEEETVVFTA